MNLEDNIALAARNAINETLARKGEIDAYEVAIAVAKRLLDEPASEAMLSTAWFALGQIAGDGGFRNQGRVAWNAMTAARKKELGI